jgi:hypothetical protein
MQVAVSNIGLAVSRLEVTVAAACGKNLDNTEGTCRALFQTIQTTGIRTNCRKGDK